VVGLPWRRPLLGLSTVISFMPIISSFIDGPLIEDSGYLPRAGLLEEWISAPAWALNGRAFVLQRFSAWCNRAAINGQTRGDPRRSARMPSTMLVIPSPFAQARLAVLCSIAGAFFARPWWALVLVKFSVYVMSFRAAHPHGLCCQGVVSKPGRLVLSCPLTASAALRRC